MIQLRFAPVLLLLAPFLEAQRPLASARPQAWESDPVLVRSRPLGLGRAVLERGAERELELELFDRQRVRVNLVRAERTAFGGRTWYGTLPSDPLGSASFAMHGSAVVGSIRSQGRLYRVRENRDGSLTLYECDQSAFPTCETLPPPSSALGVSAAPTHDPAGGAPKAMVSPQASSALGNQVVDVLVAWTQEAENAAGSADAIQALIDLAVLETNVAFQNSQVNLSLRLAHAGRTDYSESGSQATDLARLQSPSDGHLDEIHLWRQAYGADVVSLFIANDERCGRSYNMGAPPSLAFRSHAFNLVAQNCATGYYAFAHELGHGFGLDHDRWNTVNTPSRPYAYGHWTANGQYRTIMALERWGVSGTRLQYFSNPALRYAGQELGVPAPSAAAADCARALNDNAPILSEWEPTSSVFTLVKPLCTIGQTLVADDEVRLPGTIDVVLADPDEDIPAGSFPVLVLSGRAAVPSCAGFPSLNDMLVSLVLYQVAAPWQPNATRVVEILLPNVPSLLGLRLNVQPLFFSLALGQVTAGNSASVVVVP